MWGETEDRLNVVRTIGNLVRDITARFEAIGIDSPRLDARVLVAHALEVEPSSLFTRSDDTIKEAALEKALGFVERRMAREPVSRILGRREFWGLDFALAPETLDPRSDTETVVSAVLDLKEVYGDRPVRILDLGTGTGCILLAVLNDWPTATGVGVDMDEVAVTTADANADHLRLSDRAIFTQGNWTDGLEGTFDIVMSNPPYIADSERDALPAEVAQFDPPNALYGGADGLDAYRAIFPLAHQILEAHGFLAVEIGATQEDAVAKHLVSEGFKLEARKRDLSNFVRCLIARPI